MIELLHATFYRISNALLVPTLLVLLCLAAWIALMSGGLLRELASRRAVRRACGSARRSLQQGLPAATVWQSLAACPAGLPARLVGEVGDFRHDPVETSKCFDDLESDVTAALAKLTWITRTAPMLGLMGTLIPLGPALTGLATGDMSALSGNLVVAFTATVLGVLIGCVSFTLGTIRRNWYHRDLSDLEHVISRLHNLST